MTATITAQIGNTEWHLTGIRTTSGTACDHCGRSLKNLYDVRNDSTGKALTVGRGCSKSVTGWTLTASEAARVLRMAQAAGRQAQAWADFSAEYPAVAADIATADGWKGELRAEIKTGPAYRWAHWVGVYQSKH